MHYATTDMVESARLPILELMNAPGFAGGCPDHARHGGATFDVRPHSYSLADPSQPGVCAGCTQGWPLLRVNRRDYGSLKAVSHTHASPPGYLEREFKWARWRETVIGG